MLYAVLLFAFLATVLASSLMLMPKGDPVVLGRAVALRRRAAVPSQPDDEMAKSFRERVVEPILGRVMAQVHRRAPGNLRERARQRLAAAGMEGDADRFLGIQVLLTVLMTLGAGVLSAGYLARGNTLAYAVLLLVGAVLGWRLPEFQLSRRITTRRKAMAKALPEVLDLLSVSVEAGLGFDGAVQKVAERFPEPVSGEFRGYLKEIRLGSGRADAMRRLAARSGSADMQSFAAAIIQADQLGVSIAKVLRTQSEAMRVKRKQRAEEKAMQLPLKILFPLIMFIFPTLFIVILGPVAISFLTTMTTQ